MPYPLHDRMHGGHWSGHFAVVLVTIRKEIRGTAQDYFSDYYMCIPDQSKKEVGELLYERKKENKVYLEN